MGLSSAEITANWGQWWWRFNGAARLAASFGGPLIFLFNKYVLFRHLVPIKGDVGYAVVLSSIAATFVLWFLVALFTRPEPEAKLLEFYRRSRPLGWWGPIAAKVAAEEKQADPLQPPHPAPRGMRPIVTGLGIALLGTFMVAAGTIAFSLAYVGSWLALAVFSLRRAEDRPPSLRCEKSGVRWPIANAQ